MTNFVDVPIPEELEECEFENLKQFFQRECDGDHEFAEAIDFDLNTSDNRATLERIIICDVTFADNGRDVDIEYVVQFYANHQCRDQSYSEEIQRNTKGVRVGECWRFPKPPLPPDRSTSDEL